MPIQDYVYSIEDDFVINHKVNITILQLEVEDSSIITTQLHHVYANLEDDECQVWFFDALSEAEEIELDAIIAAHTGEYAGGLTPGDIGDSEGGISDLNISFGDAQGDYYVSFTLSCYDIAFHFIFPGTNIVGKPFGIKTVLKGEGSVKLYDRTNGKTIFEWDQFDNIADYTIFSKSVTSGWPENEAILEVWGRDTYGVPTELKMTCFQVIYTREVEDNEPTGGTITGSLLDPEGDRVTDELQLLYEFLEGTGSTVTDTSGVGTAHDLTVQTPSNITWLAGRGLSIDTETRIQNTGACSKFHNACVTNNEVTIEGWIKPANTSQSGPSRIISYSLDSNNGNIRLGQDSDEWVARCRTTTNDSNGCSPPTITSGSLLQAQLKHVVYTRSFDGVGKIYINGIEVESNNLITGNFSNWDSSHRIVIGNEYNAVSRKFLGEIHLAAYYSKALSSSEVMQNYLASI